MSRLQVSLGQRSVIYPMECPSIRPEVLEMIQADGFALKEEFHVTVIPSDVGDELSQAGFYDLARHLSSMPKPTPKVEDTLFHVWKPKRVSNETVPREALVARIGAVSATALLTMVQDAARAVSVNVPETFLHLTVATRPDNPLAKRGIGIANEHEWSALGPRLYREGWQA